MRFVRAPAVSGEQELLGLARAQFPRMAQPLHRGHAKGHHRIGEHRIIGGDDDIAHPREDQRAGNALALHRADRRLGDIAPAPRGFEVAFLFGSVPAVGGVIGKPAPGADPRAAFLHVGLVFGDRFRDVVPGREVLAFGRQDNDLHAVIGKCAIKRGIYREDHLRVDRVVLVSAVEHDAGDTEGTRHHAAGGTRVHALAQNVDTELARREAAQRGGDPQSLVVEAT